MAVAGACSAPEDLYRIALLSFFCLCACVGHKKGLSKTAFFKCRAKIRLRDAKIVFFLMSIGPIRRLLKGCLFYIEYFCRLCL